MTLNIRIIPEVFESIGPLGGLKIRGIAHDPNFSESEARL